MTRALAIGAAVAIISGLVLIFAHWKHKSEGFSHDFDRIRQELASLRAEFNALSRANAHYTLTTPADGHSENVKKFEHQLSTLTERIDSLSQEVDNFETS